MSTISVINIKHPTASTANITLSNTGGIALNGSVSGGGMDLITPTSVAGSGVTFSGGNISFSAAPTISVNGCFTSSYQFYRIILTCPTTQSGTVTWRMRAAGTDESSANYVSRSTTIGDVAFQASRSNAATSVSFNAQISSGGFVAVDLINPNLSSWTFGNYQTIAPYSNSSMGIDIGGWSHVVNTAFDGFSIIATSFTGTLRVYGLRNS